MKSVIFLSLSFFLNFAVCAEQSGPLVMGAERLGEYLHLIQGKNVALVVNQSSRIRNQNSNMHLVDSLLEHGVKIRKLFALEHGIRGDIDAGGDVVNGQDARTGLKVISLYGKNKTPKAQDVKDVDIILFDIQDVGVRFYTYISSLYYLLNNSKTLGYQVIVLDRPNPNGHYVAGPVLDMRYQSFVGMFPIPLVHGLTVGELAKMMVLEGWAKNVNTLKVIPVKNYTHQTRFELPIKPSPNLPTYNSIAWYPSLALFEATEISIGRGTYSPFELIGYPDSKFGAFNFTPKRITGMSSKPKHMNKKCYGDDLRGQKPQKFSIKYLVNYYKKFNGENFFKYPKFFHKLIGNDITYKQILAGKSYQEIEASWESELKTYNKLRSKYLLYKK